METLNDRISHILGRDRQALGGTCGEAISIIREMEDRLEAAYQEISMLDDLVVPPLYQEAIDKAMKLTDSVAEYIPSRDSDV